MKLCLLLMIIFVGYSEGIKLKVPRNLIERGNTELTKWVSITFVQLLQKQITENRAFGQESKRHTYNLTHHLDDPYKLQTQEFPLDFKIPNFLGSSGHLTYYNPKVTGLTGLTDHFSIRLGKNLTLEWDLNIPWLTIQGQYLLNQTVKCEQLFLDGEEHLVTGQGQLTLDLNDVLFKLKADINSNEENFLSVNKILIDTGFKEIKGHAENTKVDGVEKSLDHLFPIMKTIFKSIWTERNQKVVNEVLRCVAQQIIHECSLVDLNSGRTSCLNESIEPSCYSTQQKFQQKSSPESSQIDLDIDIHIEIDIDIDLNPPISSTTEPTTETSTEKPETTTKIRQTSEKPTENIISSTEKITSTSQNPDRTTTPKLTTLVSDSTSETTKNTPTSTMIVPDDLTTDSSTSAISGQIRLIVATLISLMGTTCILFSSQIM